MKLPLIFILLFSHIRGEYYELALLKNNNSWHLHGLWPSFTPSKWPQYCNKNKCHVFNLKELESLLPYLDKYWTSTEEPNVDFWRHEWCKHGSCTNMTLFTYFNTTLSLYFKSRRKNFYNCCNSGEDNCLLNLSWDALNFTGCSKY